MPEIQFTAHNHRVIVAPHEPSNFEPSYRPRGWVGGFSKYSKKRLTAMLNSFAKIPFRTFWCFTFDKDVPALYAKEELHRLTMIFNRRKIGWMWVMEFTENGRIHYHMGLVGYLNVEWVQNLWSNGIVHVQEIYDDEGAKDYFLKEERATFYKEVSKRNQKRFMGFNGRWWGVSRHLNLKYSLGVYDESYALALADIKGIKRNYWREDLEGIIDNPYSNFSNASAVVKSSLIQKGKVQKNEKVTKRVGGVHVLVSDHGG